MDMQAVSQQSAYCCTRPHLAISMLLYAAGCCDLTTADVHIAHGWH